MSLLSLLHGQTTSQKRAFTSVRLGPIYLSGTEVPPEIPFAGRQNVASHDLYGGGRVIQPVGPVDDPIEWTAMFVGPLAMKRARFINTYRISGKPIVFSFSGVVVSCVITEFRPVYKSLTWVPYSIRLLPYSESWNNPVIVSTQKRATFLQGLLAQANNVRAWWSATMTTAMNSLQTLGDGISDLASIPAQTVEGLTSTITTVQNEINSIQSSVENTLLNTTTLGGLFPNNPVASAVSSLSNQINAVTTQYQAENLNGIMNLSSNIVLNANASVLPFLPLVTPELVGNIPAVSQPLTEIVPAGSSLEEVALRFYGDATEWPTIASVNNLTDPLISVTQRIVIPPTPQVSSGGVLVPAGFDLTWQICPAA